MRGFRRSTTFGYRKTSVARPFDVCKIETGSEIAQNDNAKFYNKQSHTVNTGRLF